MSIGENIKHRRMERGLSQAEMAQRIGVGQSMVAQIERGTKIPSMVLGMEIAKTLGCQMDELMEDSGKEREVVC